MKHFRIFLLLVALLAGFASASAGDTFKFGPRVGVNVNSFHFNQSTFDSDNRAGWTAGLMAEFRIPVIGVGGDLSLMYVRRNASFMERYGTDKRDYFEIPLNFRYNFGFLGFGKILTPYIAAGPSAAFLTSRKSVADGNMRNRSVDWAFNAGFGLQFFNHLDISARYGWGLSRAFSGNVDNEKIDGKNRYWTITAAYLF